ncbi:MAG: LytTR family DNA-binding domain-containing protein [Bacteroidales bacterium]
MNLIKTIIVEDEPPARMKLAAFIERCPELQISQIFNDGESAFEYLKTNPDCLVFLDIQMERMTGMQLLEKSVHIPKVIITSAYEEYALKGFEYNVSDYLLKPYSFDRFRKAVDKVVREIKMEQMESRTENAYILVKSEYRLERVELDTILFVEGMKDYLRIHTASRKIMTLRSFTSLETELPETQFIRIHKSYLVAVAHITAIEKDWVCVGNNRIPIGRSYKERFLEKLRKEEISGI